jgi:EAL domain-containing protein (putative c-di-GMP-specific phosphodiesterase class I)
MLRALGCGYAQGYWFSPAVPAKEASALIGRVSPG